MRTAIINGTIITPLREVKNSVLLLKNEVVEGIYEDTEIINNLEDIEIVDVNGCYVSPGFIDMHVHGGGGYDFMDGTKEAFAEGVKAHMRHGTTSIVPTTLTCPDEELFHVFELYAQAKREIEHGPNLLGLHLEGPYFAQAFRGAQDPKYIVEPKPEHYKKILDMSNDIIRMSLAPELPGALELIDELRKRRIIISAGHTEAMYEDLVVAVEHGCSLATHLYCAMSTIKRINAFRHLGLIETSYLLDDLYVEIIADGRHLPAELLKLIVKTKPIDKICLITDAMRGADMPEGATPLLGSLKNGQPTIIEDGVAKLPDRSAFAGSVCTTDRCVKTMIQMAGVSITDAVTMVTRNPAKVLGISAQKGVLAAGMDADICVFDSDINIKKVYVKGELCYNAD